MRLDPTEATARDVLLSIDGTGSASLDALHRVEAAHDFKALREGTLRQIAVEAGHVVWSRALGEGTRLEAQNVTVDIERDGNQPLGSDLTFASPIVGVATTWGKLGSWVVSGQHDHGQTKATLTLDPSGTSRGAVTVVVDNGSVTSLDLNVPRSNVAQLGIGNDVLGRREGEPLFATADAHYAVRSASRVEASARLELSGARLTNAIGAADAQLEVHVDGDPAHPIDVTRGIFGFGPFHGTLSGPVSFGAGYLRADLGFRTGAAHCQGGGDASLGGGLVFDTRNLGDGRLLVAPSGKCSLKILPL